MAFVWRSNRSYLVDHFGELLWIVSASKKLDYCCNNTSTEKCWKIPLSEGHSRGAVRDISIIMGLQHLEIYGDENPILIRDYMHFAVHSYWFYWMHTHQGFTNAISPCIIEAEVGLWLLHFIFRRFQWSFLTSDIKGYTAICDDIAKSLQRIFKIWWLYVHASNIHLSNI